MSSHSDLILVTGATGKQGGAVARELLAAGRHVRAMTRHPGSPAAQQLRSLGAQVVHGDLDDAASLTGALEGAWGTYAIQSTREAGVEREEEQGRRFAGVARKAGVRHFVYASVGSAHRHTGIPHFENKRRIEQHVKGLGFPSVVILRPVFFMENLLMPATMAAIENGVLPMALNPQTRLQMIAVADIGKYGKLAFEQHERLKGRELDLAGDELTIPHVAEVLSRVTKHPVQHVRVPIEDVRKSSEDYASMLEWFDAVGYDVDIAGNAKEFGIPPTPFEAWTRAHWS